MPDIDDPRNQDPLCQRCEQRAAEPFEALCAECIDDELAEAENEKQG